MRNYSSESGRLFVNGSPATVDEWAEWQSARVAARDARERFEDSVTGFDRRIGRGISANRSERRGASERAARDSATVARVERDFDASAALAEIRASYAS